MGTETTLRVLHVTLGGIPCGLPLDDVVEVLPAARLEPLLGGPASVLGVLDLRGTPMAVLDARGFLGLEPVPVRSRDRFVVLDVDGRQLGLRVDAAEDLLEVPESAIHSARSVAPTVMSCAGVARLPDGLLVIHDPARFLSARETEELQQALAAHASMARA